MYMKKNPLRDYIAITFGVLLISIAIKNIYDPAGLVTGGVSGLAIVIRKALGVPLWITNTVINIPLFVLGYFMKGWKFIKRTLYATVLTSFLFMILPEGNLIPNHDLFLASVFGGILMGVGGGMVFACMATTGGTDLLAALIQTRLRHFSIPQIMQVLDWSIVAVGIGMFGVVNALYAIVSIYVFSKLSNNIIDGMHFAKAAYIISSQSAEISRRIMKDLDRGVTGIKARGLFSSQDTEMLYCVLSNREIAFLKDIVYDVDPDAFVIVSDVREVHGEGFTREQV